MNRYRIIPVLLNSTSGLVKTTRFKNPKYVGDPINAIKIFNEKEVDELIILDIDSTKNKTEPNIDFIKKIATECFMPLCYGGGITKLEQIESILFNGVEKVSLNTSAYYNPKLIKEAANKFGNQSIVVSIDVKKNWMNKPLVFTAKGTKNTRLNPVEYAKEMESNGAGELLINSIDKDGTYTGYDLELIEKISQSVTIPIISCGGAKSITDFSQAINSGASAVAAGSMFVFFGDLKSVLINYPTTEELNYLYSK